MRAADSGSPLGPSPQQSDLPVVVNLLADIDFFQKIRVTAAAAS